jgi:hypothetical protein
MTLLVDADADSLTLFPADSDREAEFSALPDAEFDRDRLCCSLSERESAALSDARPLSVLTDVLADAIWLAAPERLFLSLSSCSEFTVDKD